MRAETKQNKTRARVMHNEARWVALKNETLRIHAAICGSRRNAKNAKSAEKVYAKEISKMLKSVSPAVLAVILITFAYTPESERFL